MRDVRGVCEVRVRLGERCVGMWGSSARENAILGWMEAMNYGKEAVDADLESAVEHFFNF